MNTLREIYEYRTMIVSLIRRDLRGRYKGSALGFAWTFLNPLLQLGVYTVVFSIIMRAGIEDYYLFLFVALIPWLFFSTSVSAGASCVMAQKEMVKKIYFPREVLPIAHVTCQLVNMLLSFVVVFAVLLLSGKGISLQALLYLPIVIVAEYFLAISITMIVSAVTVYLRDLEHVLVILTMAWQFLTPVMYSIDMVPEELRSIFNINPMTPIIVAYRDILYYKRLPEIGNLLHGFVLSTILLVIGWLVFGRLKKHFAEEM
ncbi:MAG: ABC transporter permease [Eubacterium sp.]|nr:ABC transporter permease [Eubacterium sp.]MCI9411201.1 ABC transporter permease [Eubacterium sp.]